MKIKKSGTTALAEKIGVGEKMAYGSGDIAIALVNLFSLPIIFFYTDTLGLNAGINGDVYKRQGFDLLLCLHLK